MVTPEEFGASGKQGMVVAKERPEAAKTQTPVVESKPKASGFYLILPYFVCRNQWRLRRSLLFQNSIPRIQLMW